MAKGFRRIGVISTGRSYLIDIVENGLSVSQRHLQHIRDGCAICIKHIVDPTGNTPEETLALAVAKIDDSHTN